MDHLQELTKMLKENNMEKSYKNLMQVLALSRDELLSISDDVDKEMHKMVDNRQYDKIGKLTEMQNLITSYTEYLDDLISNQDEEVNDGNFSPAFPSKKKEFFSFDKIGIPVGSVIEFIDDKSIKAMVNGNKTVAFENKTWHLSQLVRELKIRNGTNTDSGAYQGSCYFTFNGEKLFDIWQKSIGR